MEYILVAAVLSMALAAAFYRPADNGLNLGGSFVHWYHDLSERVAKP